MGENVDINIRVDEEGAREAAQGVDKLGKSLDGAKKEAKQSQQEFKTLGSSLSALGPAAIAGIAIAGLVKMASAVSDLTMRVKELGQAGAFANDAAAGFTGNMDALRASVANSVDDTSLQNFRRMAKEIGLTEQETVNLNKRVVELTAQAADGSTAVDNLTKVYAGSAEGLRSLGVVVDNTSKEYEGLSETQKKLKVALDLANDGANVNVNTLKSQSLEFAQLDAMIANAESSLQQWVATQVIESGVLDDTEGAMSQLNQTLADNQESLDTLAQVSLDAFIQAMNAAVSVAGFFGDRLNDLGAAADSLGESLSVIPDILGSGGGTNDLVWDASAGIAAMSNAASQGTEESAAFASSIHALNDALAINDEMLASRDQKKLDDRLKPRKKGGKKRSGVDSSVTEGFAAGGLAGIAQEEEFAAAKFAEMYEVAGDEFGGFLSRRLSNLQTYIEESRELWDQNLQNENWTREQTEMEVSRQQQEYRGRLTEQTKSENAALQQSISAWGAYGVGILSSLDKATGGAIASQELQAALMAAVEVAAAIASFATYQYPAGAMHLASAAAYGAVAVGGWRGGGKKSSGASAVASSGGHSRASSLARPTENTRSDTVKETTIIQLQVDGRNLAEATINGANRLANDRRGVELSSKLIGATSRKFAA